MIQMLVKKSKVYSNKGNISKKLKQIGMMLIDIIKELNQKFQQLKIYNHIKLIILHIFRTMLINYNQVEKLKMKSFYQISLD